MDINIINFQKPKASECGNCMGMVFVVVLNWNGLNDTLECLNSVCRLKYPDFKVVVVDNGSSDGSVDTIRQKFSEMTIIKNNENLGFTGGNNIGIRYAIQNGADYVWLLNNDTIVEPDTLYKLVSEANMHPQTGLVSPVIRHYDNPEIIEFTGAYVDSYHFKVNVFSQIDEAKNKNFHGKLILWGTALLIKREVVETIGYLSEEYFAYAEDKDYSMRALRSGFMNIMRLDANILHKGARSTGYQSPVKIYLGMRNLFFFWRDNTQGFRRILIPGHYLGMVINNARCHLENGNRECLEACLNGFWAACKGIGGNYDPKIVLPKWLKYIMYFLVSWQPYFWVRVFRLDLTGIVRATFSKLQGKYHKT